MGALSKRNVVQVSDDSLELWAPCELGVVAGHRVAVSRAAGAHQWHAHERDELVIVWEGRLRIMFDAQETVLLEAGDTFLLEGGVLHCEVADVDSRIITVDAS